MDPLDRLRLNMYGDLLDVPKITIKLEATVKPSDRPQITSSKDAADIFRHMMKDHIETCEGFYVLYLNRANKVIGCYMASIGGITGTVADPKMMYSTALVLDETQPRKAITKGLTSLCSGMILGHNHPSGNLQPSQADIDLTKKMKEAGRFLEIQVLDHIICVPENKYYSFADEGLL